MKFFFLLAAAVLLIIGYVNTLSFVALCGSGLYILIEITNLLMIMNYERLSRKGKFYVKAFSAKYALLNQLSTFTELIILFCAAIIFLFFPNWLPKDLWMASIIIVFGQFFIWILSGLIGRWVKYVPIKMGFSSWYVQQKSNRITER